MWIGYSEHKGGGIFPLLRFYIPPTPPPPPVIYFFMSLSPVAFNAKEAQDNYVLAYKQPIISLNNGVCHKLDNHWTDVSSVALGAADSKKNVHRSESLCSVTLLVHWKQMIKQLHTCMGAIREYKELTHKCKPQQKDMFWDFNLVRLLSIPFNSYIVCNRGLLSNRVKS